MIGPGFAEFLSALPQRVDESGQMIPLFHLPEQPPGLEENFNGSVRTGDDIREKL